MDAQADSEDSPMTAIAFMLFMAGAMGMVFPRFGWFIVLMFSVLATAFGVDGFAR